LRNQHVHVVGGSVDRETSRIKVVCDPGEIRVQLVFDFRGYKVGTLFGGKDQVDENANKGLCHVRPLRGRFKVLVHALSGGVAPGYVTRALSGRDRRWYALTGGVAPGYITRALSGRVNSMYW